MTPKRTEYGKKIRKDYEKHKISEKRKNIQRLEPRNDGICNTITTVLKDNLVIRRTTMSDILKLPKSEIYDSDDRWKEEVNEDELSLPELAEYREENPDEKTVEDYLYTAADGEQYGIFKLSPRECGRLMGVLDSDIDKMLAVNSNSQCYKQYGNSIIVPVLCAIFSQLNIDGVKSWNRMTNEEREVWINPDGLKAEESDEK